MSGLCSEIEQFGKGVGNTSRFRILQELFRGPRTVGALVRATKQSQPCVSQHLKTLKAANLVTDERSGKVVRYTLNANHILGIIKKLSIAVNREKVAKK